MNTLESLARRILRELAARGETVGFCESLTAGLACATVAEVPGASQCLRGGLVTYATELKHVLAGVDPGVLERHGPVAAATAREMALGSLSRLGSDWVASFTGVAGPDTQDGHPVGEVFIGIAHACKARDEVYAVRRVLDGTRAEIRTGAVEAGLKELTAALAACD